MIEENSITDILKVLVILYCHLLRHCVHNLVTEHINHDADDLKVEAGKIYRDNYESGHL